MPEAAVSLRGSRGGLGAIPEQQQAACPFHRRRTGCPGHRRAPGAAAGPRVTGAAATAGCGSSDGPVPAGWCYGCWWRRAGHETAAAGSRLGTSRLGSCCGRRRRRQARLAAGGRRWRLCRQARGAAEPLQRGGSRARGHRGGKLVCGNDQEGSRTTGRKRRGRGEKDKADLTGEAPLAPRLLEALATAVFPGRSAMGRGMSRIMATEEQQ
ncbi:uncharacterized protein LOC132336690 [Haemorhous mexicanus]|uniref:uncharacterized protein LOC132336690 n=1 Tax=Haemorhous mexicanus TaxID=30427 RepID=UPI0028BE563D|nr:uncharacterized protein LOC132336690 [Haemorhous mexicanus]XP_059720444.1 uncharacterized protein LOC132336690 [Haemorhous mexicanus]